MVSQVGYGQVWCQALIEAYAGAHVALGVVCYPLTLFGWSRKPPHPCRPERYRLILVLRSCQSELAGARLPLLEDDHRTEAPPPNRYRWTGVGSLAG